MSHLQGLDFIYLLDDPRTRLVRRRVCHDGYKLSFTVLVVANSLSSMYNVEHFAPNNFRCLTVSV
jgi:hypothetical protein